MKTMLLNAVLLAATSFGGFGLTSAPKAADAGCCGSGACCADCAACCEKCGNCCGDTCCGGACCACCG